MPLLARISHHLDLYRYWLAKRGSRPMPARSDINPGDIPALLPYLGLVNKVVGQFRWRLTGTGVADKIGRNLTGTVVGSHANNAPESVAALQSIFERTFASAHPVFATGEYKAISGTPHCTLDRRRNPQTIAATIRGLWIQKGMIFPRRKD